MLVLQNKKKMEAYSFPDDIESKNNENDIDMKLLELKDYNDDVCHIIPVLNDTYERDVLHIPFFDTEFKTEFKTDTNDFFHVTELKETNLFYETEFKQNLKKNQQKKRKEPTKIQKKEINIIKLPKNIQHNLFILEHKKNYVGPENEFHPRLFKEYYTRIRKNLKVFGDKKPILKIKKKSRFIKYKANMMEEYYDKKENSYMKKK